MVSSWNKRRSCSTKSDSMAAAVGMEPIEVAIKGIVNQGCEIHAENVSQRGGTDPVRHGVLAVGGRISWFKVMAQGELNGLDGEAPSLEDRVESQPLPELEADMDGAGGAVPRGGDPVYMHGDEVAGPIRSTGRLDRLRRRASPASPNLADYPLYFWIGI